MNFHLHQAREEGKKLNNRQTSGRTREMNSIASHFGIKKMNFTRNEGVSKQEI